MQLYRTICSFVMLLRISPYSLLLWRSFKKEYIYNKCCPRCAYAKLKYNAVNKNVAKYV